VFPPRGRLHPKRPRSRFGFVRSDHHKFRAFPSPRAHTHPARQSTRLLTGVPQGNSLRSSHSERVQFSLAPTRRNPTRKTTWFDSKLRYYLQRGRRVDGILLIRENTLAVFALGREQIFSFARPLEEALHANKLGSTPSWPTPRAGCRTDGNRLISDHSTAVSSLGRAQVFCTSPRSEPTRKQAGQLTRLVSNTNRPSRGHSRSQHSDVHHFFHVSTSDEPTRTLE